VKTLIVNADDFGRTPGINRGIVEAHRDGIVTSTTMMVNYPAAAEAAKLAESCPALGVGLHLALTGGPSALPARMIPTLVDGDGRLPSKPEGLTRATLGEVLAEGRAQLARFRALMGRLPTHFDSHHHSHRLPVVFEALAKLAGETNLPVRCASPGMAERLRAAGIRTTDTFVESFFDESATLETLRSILSSLGDGSCELMCHPAYADPELVATSGYARAREKELAVLTSRAAREAVDAHGISLANFARL